MSDSPAESCAERLERAGLTPVCPPEGCEMVHESPAFHRYCEEAPPLAPIQAIGCYNQQTGEWRFAPPDRILRECSDLNSRDPAWELLGCYCCCP